MMARLETLEGRTLLSFEAPDLFLEQAMGQQTEHTEEGDDMLIEIFEVMGVMSNFIVAAVEGLMVTSYFGSFNYGLKALDFCIHPSPAKIVFSEMFRFTMNYIIAGCVSELVDHVQVDHSYFNAEASKQNREDFMTAFWQTYGSYSTYAGLGVGVIIAYGGAWMAAKAKLSPKDALGKLV